MKIPNNYCYYYVLLSLSGLPHFLVLLAEPTQILLSEVVFLWSIFKFIPNNAQAWQAFPLFIFSFFKPSCFCLWWSKNHYLEAEFRKGSMSGQGKTQICSLAWLSPVPPSPWIPLSFAADSSLPHITLHLCWVKSVCKQTTSRTCKQLQMQNIPSHTQSDPGRPQQSQPGVTSALGQAGESPYPASCPKTTRLEPSSNQHIVHQNQEVQKGLLDLESREKNPTIRSAFSWFLLSSSVITQL